MKKSSSLSKLAVVAEEKIHSVDDLSKLLINLRAVRREFVKNASQNLGNDNKHITSFKNVEKSLKQCIKNSYECVLNVDSVQLKFNLQDEYLGVQKDLLFLDYYFSNNKANWLEFIKKLAGYHPQGVDKFLSEMETTTNLFKNVMKETSEGGVTNGEIKNVNENHQHFDYFYTDWDGTYKTYGTTYSTCMQPVYSGLVLTKFVEKFTKFHAVLTAGPLRGPGILDLTSVPENLINFGGSWGREWSLADNFVKFNCHPEMPVVDMSCFTEGNQNLFKKLTIEVENLLNTETFAQFKRVGSGLQKKVDRLTIGVQNVIREIPKEKAESLVKAIENILLKLDPLGDVFLLEKSSLDLEIVVKKEGSKKSWSKADGLNFLKNRLNLNLNDKSSVVVCGDTYSDISMVEYFTSRNIKVSAIFVNAEKDVAEKLKSLTPSYCLVGCPEVIHAAMLNLLQKSDQSVF